MYRICQKCKIEHYENCQTCLGFGVKSELHYGELVPIIAYDAIHGTVTDWRECPTCHSTIKGIPKTKLTEHHKKITKDLPTAHNPNLDSNAEQREQMVTCVCGNRYLVWTNGTHSINDFSMDGVSCPHCQAPASEWRRLAGHSAGVFNATVYKYLEG
jgi:hypothetical protein